MTQANTSQEIESRFAFLMRMTVALFAMFCVAFLAGHWIDRNAETDLVEIQEAETAVSRLGQAISYTSMLISAGIDGDIEALRRVDQIEQQVDARISSLQNDFQVLIDASVIRELRKQHIDDVETVDAIEQAWRALGEPGTDNGQRGVAEEAAQALATEISGVASGRLLPSYSALRRSELMLSSETQDQASNRLNAAAADFEGELLKVDAPAPKRAAIEARLSHYIEQVRKMHRLQAGLNLIRREHDQRLGTFFRTTQELEREIQLAEIAVIADVGFQRNLSNVVTWLPALATLCLVLVTISRVRTVIVGNDRTLRTVSARFKDFAKASSDVFWESDKDGRLTFAEGLDSFPSAFSADQLLGRQIGDIFAMYGVTDRGIVGYVMRCIDSGQAFRNVVFATTVTGKNAWRRASAVPFYDNDGTFLGMRGSLVDATAEIDATRGRQTLLNRARAAALAHHETLFIVDPHGFIESVEGPNAEYVERKLNESSDRSVATFLSTFESNPVGGPRLLDSIAQRRSFSDQIAKARSPMTENLEYYRVSGAPITGDDGADHGYVFAAHNVHQEYVARDALHEKERMMASIVENTPAAFYSFTVLEDGRYRINHLPSRFAWVFGMENVSQGDICDPANALPADQLELTRRADEAGRKGLEYFDVKRKLKKPDGVEVWISSQGRYTRLADGTLLKEGVAVDITDQVEIEQSLRDQRRQYAEVVSALDQSHDAAMIAHLEEGITYCNPAFCRLVHIASPSVAFGKKSFELFTSIDTRFDYAAMTQDIERTGHSEFEYDVLLHDGTHRVFAGSVTQLDDQNQIVTLRDVTDENEARQAKDRINAAISHLARSDAVASGSIDTAFAAISEEVLEGLEIDRVGIWLVDRAAGMLRCHWLASLRDGSTKPEMAVPLVEVETYFNALKSENAVAARDVYAHNATSCFADKYLKPIGVKSKLAMPIYFGGAITGVMCCETLTTHDNWSSEEMTFVRVACDIAAHALEVARKIEAQDRLADLTVQSAQIGRALDIAMERILIADADGVVTYANSAARKDLDGGTPAGPVGRLLTAALLGYDGLAVDLVDRIRQGIAKDGRWSGTESYVRDSDSEDVGTLRFAVWPTDTGGTIYMWSDVTEEETQARREQALREELGQAKKSEALGNLAGGIAHDFNNIISAVQSFAQLLSIKLDGDDNQKYADRIVTSCERAAALVKQVMAFSTAGMVERTPIRVLDHLDDVFALVRARLPENIELKTQLDADSPAVEANPTQVVQLILNLCVNAADAIGSEKFGHIAVTSRVQKFDRASLPAYRAGLHHFDHQSNEGPKDSYRFVFGRVDKARPYLVLAVTDNGPGIPKNNAERIFEPFFTTKSKGRGNGLGLAICANAVTAMGGAIALTSRPGHGASFEVFLPVSKQVPVAPVQSEQRAEKVRGFNRGRVLIVDDEIDLADAMSESLTLQGFETLPVYDPDEALNVFKSDPGAWQVVLTDQVMPKTNGLTLIAEMKRIRPDIPVILYSGYGEVTTEQKAIAAGAAAFFRKPVSANVIAARIDTLCAPKGTKAADRLALVH